MKKNIPHHFLSLPKIFSILLYRNWERLFFPQPPCAHFCGAFCQHLSHPWRTIHILRKQLKGGGVKNCFYCLFSVYEICLDRGKGVKKAPNCAYVIYERYLNNDLHIIISSLFGFSSIVALIFCLDSEINTGVISG